MLTLKTIGVEKIFAFLVTLDSTFSTFETLSGDTPEKSFTFITVRRMSERTEFKIMRGRQRDGIDQCLQCLLVNMRALQQDKSDIVSLSKKRVEKICTSSSSLRLCLPMALGTPADRLFTEIP